MQSSLTLSLVTVTLLASCATAQETPTNGTFSELVSIALTKANAPAGLNATCLACFCRDNLNTDCASTVWSELNDHYADDVYGFDYDYWHATQDSTAAETSGTMNYADCRRDLACATQTVVKYLTKHRTQCLNATLEAPGCLDYAIIQFNGVEGCAVPAPQKGRWSQLNECLAALTVV